jgi:lactoylglutathione lyase
MNGQRGCVAIARVDRVGLSTPDPEALGAFYAEHLGALASPVCIDPETGQSLRVLDFCGVGVELIQAPADGRAAGPQAGIGFALGSADAVDRLTDRLGATGHPVVEPPHRSWEGSYRSVVLDPDGNRIELTV